MNKIGCHHCKACKKPFIPHKRVLNRKEYAVKKRADRTERNWTVSRKKEEMKELNRRWNEKAKMSLLEP